MLPAWGQTSRVGQEAQRENINFVQPFLGVHSHRFLGVHSHLFWGSIPSKRRWRSSEIVGACYLSRSVYSALYGICCLVTVVDAAIVLCDECIRHYCLQNLNPHLLYVKRSTSGLLAWILHYMYPCWLFIIKWWTFSGLVLKSGFLFGKLHFKSCRLLSDLLEYASFVVYGGNLRIFTIFSGLWFMDHFHHWLSDWINSACHAMKKSHVWRPL